MENPAPKKQTTLNRASVASIVLALVPVPGLAQMAAIVCGLWAHRQITRAQGTQRGYGLALAGIMLGCVGVTAAIILFLTPTFLALHSGRGPDQLGRQGIAIRAHYGVFGDLKALVVARKADSQWPAAAFRSWPGNLTLVDARTAQHLVLDIPEDQLARFWLKAQDPEEPIAEALRWLNRNLDDLKGRAFIEQMLAEPEP